ncbi:MAG: permease [Desulfobulbus sp.]|nr:permease [Desulfobulbus sp.]
MYYCSALTLLAVLWWLAYTSLSPFVHHLVFNMCWFAENSPTGLALEFFIYDTVKILLLLTALIYVIAWLRTAMRTEQVREYLRGKRRVFGYFLGALSGAVTPFCSCSSIPLFLGFTTAGIPIGISMSFLITSPIINEIAVVVLWGLLGWKFTLSYMVVGMLAGIIGGFVMDGCRADRWLQPFVRATGQGGSSPQFINYAGKNIKPTVRQRHDFAYREMASIFRRVWKWVVIGVGLGAALHGFVPENWFAQNLGSGRWWTVPASVFVAIPLYSNVTGIVPIMESLLTKGLPIGTTLAFCMSAVAASLPEILLLRQIMQLKLQLLFIFYLWVMFTLVGWLFNSIGHLVY